MLKSKSFTSNGNKKTNEDYVLINEKLGLYIVADGVSSTGNGEIASKIACETIEQEIIKGCSLERATYIAHQKVKEYSVKHLDNYTATTLVAIIIKNEFYDICWVGCVRIYSWIDKIFNLLTTDDSLDEFLRMNELSNSNPKKINTNKVLIQAIGMKEREIFIHSKHGGINDNMSFLLCSDGFHQFIDSDNMVNILSNYHEFENKSRMIETFAREQKATDDMSFIYIEKTKTKKTYTSFMPFKKLSQMNI